MPNTIGDSEWVLDGPDAAERRDPHGHRHVDLAAGAGPVFRQVADHLIENGIGESVELDLGHRHEPPQCQSDRNTDHCRLGQRGVEAALRAERRVEAFGHPEDPAQRGDVLTEDQDALISLHCIVQRSIERLDHRQR